MIPPPESVGERIQSAAQRLRAAGVTKPRREANRLWAWLHRLSPGEAYLTRERAADPDLVQAFEAAVDRRAAGEPLAYVLGHTGFRRLELRCDRRALIPRPESEGVIDQALRRVRRGRALDLCTGSGCLALALAEEGDFDSVTGVDCSRAALELAALNATVTGQQVGLVLGDLGAAFRPASFALLVANPPYVTESEYAALDPAVRAWEPRLALVGGADGLALTRRVLSDAVRLLEPGGWLVMELDSTRASAVAALAGAAGMGDVALWDDLFGRPRYLTARREQLG